MASIVSKAVAGGAIVAAAAVAAGVWSNLAVRSSVAALAERTAAVETKLEAVLGEITRLRIEQRQGKLGPEALLERLQTYAPLLTSSRTTAPDFKMAKDEMDAVMRAFASIGKDAFAPIEARFRSLDPGKSFEEAKYLLHAAVHADAAAGRRLAAAVLQGSADVKPTPRLRWAAADLLVNIDQPLAQNLLRKILLAESYRGRDPMHAASYDLAALDPSAVATTGFHTFVLHYLRTQDPQTEDTLLQVLQRADNDLMTVQEIVEWLGQQRCVRADQRIEELYRHPPGPSENALFLNKCLTALAAIRGKDARPFLEAELAKANNDAVARHIAQLLEPSSPAAQASPQPIKPK